MTELGDTLRRQVAERAKLIGFTAAAKMEVELRRNWGVHSKSGETLKAISVRLETATPTSLVFVAKAETPQARYVNDGTRPHVITPKANPGAISGSKWPSFIPGEPLLFFFWARVGRNVRFRWVDHPGYRGSGWWDFALARWSDLLQESVT